MTGIRGALSFGRQKLRRPVLYACKKLYRFYRWLDVEGQSEGNMFDNPISKRIDDYYHHMAGLASVFELNIRLEADVIDDLEPLSMGDLKPLVEKFVEYYAVKMGKGEAEAILRAHNLRNKISHSDFKALFGKFKDHPEVNAGKATMLKFDTGAIKPVKETTKREGKLFGWMLEAATNGTFEQAIAALEEAIKIVRRLGLERATSVVVI